MLTEDLVRLQLWDQLSRGLDPKELPGDGTGAGDAGGLAERLRRRIRGLWSAADGAALPIEH